MPELTPLDDNRQEHFLNGEDLEPITRREYFYAGRESELPEGHQEPETREEWFIKKYRGGGGGDITVESLSVTSNGTYTAPSGKAYSPVEVDVPLPENAYLLKSVANLPQAIASFNDGQDMVMPSLKVAIEPQQEGSGDPSPSNPRPIIGWNEVNVTVADDVENPTVSNVYTIDLDGTRYGGEVDVVNGGGTDRLKYVDMGDITWSYDGNGIFFVNNLSGLKINGDAISSAYKTTKSYPTVISTDGTLWVSDARNQLVVHNNAYTSASDFKTAMSGVQLVYELATPLTIQLTPTQVKSLLGQNNIWADTGDITDAEYFSKEV